MRNLASELENNSVFQKSRQSIECGEKLLIKHSLEREVTNVSVSCDQKRTSFVPLPKCLPIDTTPSPTNSSPSSPPRPELPSRDKKPSIRNKSVDRLCPPSNNPAQPSNNLAQPNQSELSANPPKIAVTKPPPNSHSGFLPTIPEDRKASTIARRTSGPKPFVPQRKVVLPVVVTRDLAPVQNNRKM